ncbi:MAG: LLM class flavin-dependent oxidoreductase [Anaerolineae bacterium]
MPELHIYPSPNLLPYIKCQILSTIRVEETRMHYGIYIPNFGNDTSARMLVDLARDAEEAGWDGFFLMSS